MALEAAKGEKTISQLASEHSIHPNQIREWKQKLLNEGAAVFSRDNGRREREQQAQEAELYEQIGRLKRELEWLNMDSRGRVKENLMDSCLDFTERAQDFAKYTDAPWGKMRSEMIDQQLSRHLESGLRVLDVGCGPGEMAVRMAQKGHHVTGIDFSPGMLEEAEKRARHSGVCIDFLEGDLKEIPRHFDAFDLLMCHCVLEYLDDPILAIKAMSEVLVPGGLLSLLISNPNARVLKTAIIDLNPRDARRGFERVSQVNKIFESPTRIYGRPFFEESLANSGLSIVEYYGVRIFTDYIDNVKTYEEEFFADLLELEMAFCQKEPFRDIANYYHLIAIKLKAQ